jgi:Ca-activated chloride channel family protein
MVFTIMGLVRVIGLFLISYCGVLWAGWWKTPDQEAYQSFKHQEYSKAHAQFQNPEWKAATAYKMGRYTEAMEWYAKQNTSDAWYNLGNSLALAHDYPHALNAYQKALSLEPNHADAKHNLEIIKKLLEEKKQNKEQQKQDKEQQKQDKEQQKQDKEEQKQDKEQQKQDKEQQKQDKEQQKQDKEEQMEAKRQASKKELNQWLKLIEDNPEGLLKQKFLRDYQREIEGGQS